MQTNQNQQFKMIRTGEYRDGDARRTRRGKPKSNNKDYINSSINVMLGWQDGSISPVSLTDLGKTDPVACAMYAKENNLLDMPGWKRFKFITRRQKNYIRMINQAKLRSYRTAPKYMFGFEIP